MEISRAKLEKGRDTPGFVQFKGKLVEPVTSMTSTKQKVFRAGRVRPLRFAAFLDIHLGLWNWV